jgi:cytochrome P450
MKVDAYPRYLRLRRRGPVVRSPSGVWIATGHAAVTEVERFGPFRSNFQLHGGRQAGSASIADVTLPSLPMLDPPTHTRLRRVVAPYFDTRAANILEPFVVAECQRLLNAILVKSEADLVEDYAKPLAAAVICRILSIPDADQQRVMRWAEVMGSSFAEPLTDANVDAFHAASAYFDGLYQGSTEDAQDSLISVLRKEVDAGEITRQEMMGLAMTTLVAGVVTTLNFVASAAWLLLSYPRELRPADIDETVIKELLRCVGPAVIGGSRTASRDVDLGGVTIRAGEAVVPVFGAANWDSDVFEQPEKLCFTRTNLNRHVAFGWGVHRCLGAGLATMEAQVALRELVGHRRELEIVGSPRISESTSVRGLQALLVRVIGKEATG